MTGIHHPDSFSTFTNSSMFSIYSSTKSISFLLAVSIFLTVNHLNQSIKGAQIWILSILFRLYLTLAWHIQIADMEDRCTEGVALLHVCI